MPDSGNRTKPGEGSLLAALRSIERTRISNHADYRAMALWMGEVANAALSGDQSRTAERIHAIAAQAHYVIDAIEGAEPAGGAELWIALWELRSLLLDVDDLNLSRPGGVA